MFEEGGMEVYETTGMVWAELENSDNGGGSKVNAFALRLRERMERLQQKIYAVQGEMEQMSLEETTQNARLEEWVGHVEETLDGLEMVPNKELASRHRPWEL